MKKQLKLKPKTDMKLVPLIMTCKDLADECHNCTNILSLIDISSKQLTDKDEQYATANKILKIYWNMRKTMIFALYKLIENFDDPINNEDIDKFIRHNNMCNVKDLDDIPF